MERSMEASATIPVAFARAQKVLLDDPGAVFSETHTVNERRERRFRMDLGVDIGTGASVHHMVILQLGVPRSVQQRLELPLAWHPTGRGRLLPSFTGQLEASESSAGTYLRLIGAYTVPLGVVGSFGDGLVGRWLAGRSLDALVEGLARRLESEVQLRLSSVGW